MFKIHYTNSDLVLKIHMPIIDSEIILKDDELKGKILTEIGFSHAHSLFCGIMIPLEEEFGMFLLNSITPNTEELILFEHLSQPNGKKIIEVGYKYGGDINTHARDIHNFLHKNVSATTYENLSKLFKD